MELRHLRLVRAAAKHGSLTKASEVLFLTQSALSHQLKELESELGTVIFHRVNQGLVLTEAGEIILEHSNTIFSEVNELYNQLNRQKNGEIGNLKISLEAYTTYHWLPAILKSFNEAFPHIQVNISTEKTKRPLQQLKNETIDFAITVGETSDPVYECTPLFKDEVIVLLNKEHPLSNHDFIEVQDLNEEKIITHSEPDERHMILENTSADATLNPRKYQQIDLTSTIIDLIKENMGVAILSRWAVSPFLAANENLKAIKLNKTGTFRFWYLVSLQKKEKKAYETAFIRLLNDTIALPTPA